MKYIKLAGLLLCLTSCNSNIKRVTVQPAGFVFYENDTTIKLQKGIVTTDSVKTTCYLTFKSFDKNKSLVRELIYYQCQNNSKAGYLTRNVYDNEGKLILRQTFNIEGAEIERNQY